MTELYKMVLNLYGADTVQLTLRNASFLRVSFSSPPVAAWVAFPHEQGRMPSSQRPGQKEMNSAQPSFSQSPCSDHHVSVILNFRLLSGVKGLLRLPPLDPQDGSLFSGSFPETSHAPRSHLKIPMLWENCKAWL